MPQNLSLSPFFELTSTIGMSPNSWLFFSSRQAWKPFRPASPHPEESGSDARRPTSARCAAGRSMKRRSIPLPAKRLHQPALGLRIVNDQNLFQHDAPRFFRISVSSDERRCNVSCILSDIAWMVSSCPRTSSRSSAPESSNTSSELPSTLVSAFANPCRCLDDEASDGGKMLRLAQSPLRFHNLLRGFHSQHGFLRQCCRKFGPAFAAADPHQPQAANLRLRSHGCDRAVTYNSPARLCRVRQVSAAGPSATTTARSRRPSASFASPRLPDSTP